MNKEYLKSLAIKALWAAGYGALAEVLAIQKIDKTTLYVAVIAALARGIIIFVTTMKEGLTPSTSAKTTIKAPKKKWTTNL
mgnify:CR=1 FL=1